MKKAIYSSLNNLIPGLLFSVGCFMYLTEHLVLGCVIYIVAYISLDLHSYIDKKLNYPNNLFIKN